jgi:hypothetical protein
MIWLKMCHQKFGVEYDVLNHIQCHIYINNNVVQPTHFVLVELSISDKDMYFTYYLLQCDKHHTSFT